MKNPVTWILTADHQRARVFAFDRSGAGLRPVPALTLDQDLPVSHEAGAHRPDIGFAARGGPAHGVEPRTTPHDKAARRFLEQVVAAVTASADRGAFQRLILVAPPRALGELRDSLPEAVRDRVVGELDFDLTKATPETVEAHIERFLA